MILIFDENLSLRLPGRLADQFPSSTHVEHMGVKGHDDISLWNRAKEIKSAMIVSKDDDFRELALAFGPPPKVLMLLIGNRTTSEVERLLRQHVQQIEDFAADGESALLEICL